jgi:hypothetical protein
MAHKRQAVCPFLFLFSNQYEYQEVRMPEEQKNDQNYNADVNEMGGIIEEKAVRTDEGSSYVHEERAAEVVPSEEKRHDLRVSRTKRAIFSIAHIIAVLIGVRMLLVLFNANPDSPFVNIWNVITAPLVAPFINLFGPPLESGIAITAGSLLFGIFIYYVIAWIISKITSLIMSRPVSSRKASTSR